MSDLKSQVEKRERLLQRAQRRFDAINEREECVGNDEWMDRYKRQINAAIRLAEAKANLFSISGKPEAEA